MTGTALTLELVRRLLRSVREPARLEAEAGADDLKRAMLCPTARDAMLALIDRGLRHEAPLLREIVRRCDLEGEPTLAVAASVGFSPRQFFRYRNAALRALALHLDRALERAIDHPAPRHDEAIAIARLLIGHRAAADAQRVIQYLTPVIARDPEHAEAFALLSDAYLVLGHASALPPAAAYSRALALAEFAQAVDPGSAEVQAAYALALYNSTGDAERALPFVEQALLTNPAVSRAHFVHSVLREALGDCAAARDAIARAAALEPAAYHYRLQELLLRGGRKTDARVADWGVELLGIDPTSRLARRYAANALIWVGRFDETIALLHEAAYAPGGFSFMPTYARALAGTGSLAKARALSDRMREIETVWMVPHYFRAAMRAAIEDVDGAVGELHLASREEPGWLPLVRKDPAFDFVRDHALMAPFAGLREAS